VVFESERFGKINYKKNEIIWMAKGFLGFEGSHQFVLLSPEEQDPFKWLQSVDNDNLAFLVIDPLLVKPDYKIDINPKDLAILECKNAIDLMIYLLVTIPQGRIELMTANLQAPIVINRANMQAIQLIVNESGHVTQYPIFKALEKKLFGDK
jgi:flagellar assembly factor FliW